MGRFLGKPAIKGLGIAWMLFFIPHFGCAVEDLRHKNEEGPHISLLLASGDPELLVAALFGYWQREGGGPFPRLLAAEPGPIDLDSGLRLLPNEVAPKLSLPDLLLISTSGDLKITDPVVAFVRRCLHQGVPVWVIGPYASDLFDVGFRPERVFRKLEASELEQALLAWCPNSGG